VPDVGWDEVRARRLARSSLHERTSGDRVAGLTAALCGVHAQVQTSAGLQLAGRIEDFTEGDLRAALWEERTLVKAWTVRGTLHLHPAEELPLWLAARRAVLGSAAAGLPAWRDPQGATHPALGAVEVEAVRAEIREALDGRCLLREELAAAVVERVGDGPRERLRSGFAFFLEGLCQGPPQGSRITLARPDHWISGWREVTDEREALREICRRFLRTYGPTGPAGFCEWLGSAAFRVAEVQRLFDELAPELDEVDVDGRRCFVLAGDTSFPQPAANEVRLLPEYDVYVMGFRERDQLVPDSVRELIAKHGRGRYEGPAGTRLVVVGGIAVGLWDRHRRGRRIELQVRLARRSGKPGRRALEREAEHIGAFFGLEPVLQVESN
jgi:DNA glycosylase AlkZ-like